MPYCLFRTKAWLFGVTLAALPLVLMAAGCGEEGNDPPEVCSTDSAWLDGDEESPLMHPGGDCIACHANHEGHAPTFVIAGTVMGDMKDDTNCNGVEGATVEITDANNQVITLTTNAAGNFFRMESEGAIAMPFKAKVIVNGQERAMNSTQSNGSCNSCHTAQGANGAPGRIVGP